MSRRILLLSAVAVVVATATCAGGSETDETGGSNGPGPTTTSSAGGMGGGGPTTTTSSSTTSTQGGGGIGGSGGMGGMGGMGGSVAVCGNGMMESGEGCDDGNMNNNDDCPDGVNGTCQPASCTDGFVHSGGTGTEEGLDCGGSCPDGCPEALLLSELVVTPTAGEMFEIHNPSHRAVPLDDVYLADYPSYYEITQATSPPISSDFRLRFPPNTSIAPGGYITVSTQSATDFNNTYAQMPDFDLSSSDMGAPVMLGEFSGTSGVSNGDEMLVMFRWDGTSDLVTDIDYLLWGDASDAMDKSNVTVGGGTYNPETATSSQSFASAPTNVQALGHCLLAEGTEVSIGGNGPNGADETSENMALTWQPLAPTPGAPNNCGVIAAVESQAATITYLRRNDMTSQETVSITMTGQTVEGVTGMARHPTSNEIYAVIKLMSSRPLARLNIATGEATMVGTPAEPLSTLAFTANGTLYGVTGNNANTPEQLNSVNLTSGLLTAITTFNDGGDGEAMAFSPQTSLLYRMSGLSGQVLMSVDPVGPVVTNISYSGTPPGEATGAYWDPDANHMVVFDLNFDVLNVTTGGVVTATNLTVSSSMKGAVIP